ncbi:hypothetical protein [Pseudalkalibacillus caeni]|uniref:Uncharacterized protein n=1 Tax=Exobacillus caeni TaxID=2574798 RepID=A0A5R9FD73_9BACL|nr:hypothetical protein [Pseudalkalibacillus caeni]TLS37605.1 hypothetical protein FCL54_10730 [Pseudalkalibacillus caeni]
MSNLSEFQYGDIITIYNDYQELYQNKFETDATEFFVKRVVDNNLWVSHLDESQELGTVSYTHAYVSEHTKDLGDNIVDGGYNG